jgi:hypothetical protein
MTSNVPERFSLRGIIAGLMLADHFGDVADEINHLHDLIGLPRPEGGFVGGWAESDFAALGMGGEPDDDEPALPPADETGWRV